MAHMTSSVSEDAASKNSLRGDASIADSSIQVVAGATQEFTDDSTSNEVCGNELDMFSQLSASNSIEREVSAAQTPSTSEKSQETRPVSSKDEILNLRDEVKTLTDQLKALSPAGGAQKIRTRSQLWKVLAMRQLERRRKAEEENVRLREMVDVQIQEAKNLRRILKRRTKIQMMKKVLGIKCWPSQTAAPRSTTPAIEERTQVFNQILQDVEQTHADVDTLIQEMDIYNIPCPGRNRKAAESMLNGVCLELMERCVVPFSVGKTATALWGALLQLEFQDLQCVDSYKVDTQFHTQNSEQGVVDTVMADLIIAYSSSDFDWSYKVRKVVRKYVEADRTVFVYRTCMEPKLPGLTESVGVVWTSTLMSIVRQGVMSSGEEATFIRSYFYATRRDEGLPIAQRLRLPANLMVAISVWDESIPRIYQQVEGVLVDEAITRHANVSSTV